MRAALALLLLVAVPSVADALCAMPMQGSAKVETASTTLAADGGVLVRSTTNFDFSKGEEPGAANAINKGWRFSDGKTAHTPTLVTLAPGLVLYVPPKGVTGELTLLDGKVERAKVTIGTDTPALLAAPDAKSARMVKVPVRWGHLLQVHATTKAAPPAGAIAVIVFVTKNRKQVARSWKLVDSTKTDFIVGGTEGRCDPGTPGEVLSKAGDKIQLAWVDAHGRLSPLSKPVTIQKAK
jgi:hypothetical protein